MTSNPLPLQEYIEQSPCPSCHLLHPPPIIKHHRRLPPLAQLRTDSLSNRLPSRQRSTHSYIIPAVSNNHHLAREGSGSHGIGCRGSGCKPLARKGDERETSPESVGGCSMPVVAGSVQDEVRELLHLEVNGRMNDGCEHDAITGYTPLDKGVDDSRLGGVRGGETEEPQRRIGLDEEVRPHVERGGVNFVLLVKARKEDPIG
mmetsp:Transcript_12268/g.28785  ORF Transcript_12268/g.28785 Transcript_12268/m.28785 type:complete len:203 (-) Transcript_12268:402-1010(-)